MSDERRIYVNGFAGKYRCQFDFISGGGGGGHSKVHYEEWVMSLIMCVYLKLP